MAIQKRLLTKLKGTYVALDMVSKGNFRDTHTLLQRMKEAQILCKKGLPQAAYEKYGEVYDGLIMAFNQILSGESGNDTQEILSLCKDLLQHIVVETKKETKFKKEMFFLPYKASMWDSLESVWKAADEDNENCLAYVMPIPYCDRNPDGTAREWHCERNEFPKYVPTLDWQSVDLKKWHPDVIFYHYPYDNCNIVTSQDEAYYSSNLKECADKLVYIPYFVLEEPEFDYDDPEKEEEVVEAENRMSNYILEPGVMNADLIIVQSEAMKKVYVNVLTRFTNASREYWEEHILGIGSPKFDKVFGSRKEDFELPEKWEKLIAGRKTILYNTGLTAMLEHTDKFVSKIRSVLDIFREQDEVALWWRPHPLLRATIEAMHPELLGEYDEIAGAYRQEGWGIYDDTSDLDRAIACTDGYYGDWSSVVHLYEKTGKPIMVQYIEEPSDDDDQSDEQKRNEVEVQEDGSKRWEFAIFDFIDYKGYYWFAAVDYNALFRMDKQTKIIEYLGSFPNEDILANRLYTTVTEWQGKLYFTPCTAHEIGVYDTKNGKFGKISIGITSEENDISNIKYQKKFVSSFIHLNTLILMPCCYDRVVYCNLVTEEISEDVNSCDYFRNKYGKKTRSTDDSYYFCWFAFRVNDNEIAFHLHNNANKVVFFNLLKRTFWEETVGNENNTYLCSAFDGENIWLYNLNGDSIISWNRNNGKSKEICVKEKIANLELHGLSYSFINMNILGDYIYLIPALSNMVVEVNLKNKEITRSDVLSEECIGEANVPFTHMCKRDGNSLFLCGVNKKEFIEYSMNGEKKKTHLLVPEKYREDIHERILLENIKNWERIWWEPGITVSEFIGVFDKKNYEKVVHSTSNGEDIFENVIQRIS